MNDQQTNLRVALHIVSTLQPDLLLLSTTPLVEVVLQQQIQKKWVEETYFLGLLDAQFAPTKMLDDVFSANSSYTKPIKEQLLADMAQIIAIIYEEHRANEKKVILIMVSFIVRMANQKMHNMLSLPRPTVANPQPSTWVPPYHDILQHLVAGRIESLCAIAPALLRGDPPPGPAPQRCEGF